jgi:hypothetical protein
MKLGEFLISTRAFVSSQVEKSVPKTTPKNYIPRGIPAKMKTVSFHVVKTEILTQS